MRKRSIKINAILNIINTVLTMSFSLLTFPYATRALQAEHLGKVLYSNSIASYFSLIAGLGFSTYAVREGGALRDNNDDVEKFSSQIFTLNGISVIISYAFLFIFLLSNHELSDYRYLILIESIAMINNWICVNWINVIFEDYVFITIRSIAIQTISIIFLFLFVHGPEDYYIYACINIFSYSVLALINFMYVRRYCRISFTTDINYKKHLPPIVVLFFNNLAVSVYMSSDNTLLGWLVGDKAVGIYGTSVKIYTAIKNIIAALYNVAVVRMSKYYSENKIGDFSRLLNDIVNNVIFVSFPCTFGLCYEAEKLVVLLNGPSYIESARPLKILSFAFIFAILGGALAYCVCIPIKKEKTILYATTFSALENIFLNILIIPRYSYVGAAITTLLSEITVFFILFFSLKNMWPFLFNWKKIVKNVFETLIGCLIFAPVLCYVDEFNMSIVSKLIIQVSTCVILYLTFELLIGNDCIKSIYAEFLKKIKRGVKNV